MKQIMIYGNPVEGFRYVGPFDSHDAAMKYGQDEGGDWWIAELDAPESGPNFERLLRK